MNRIKKKLAAAMRSREVRMAVMMCLVGSLLTVAALAEGETTGGTIDSAAIGGEPGVQAAIGGEDGGGRFQLGARAGFEAVLGADEQHIVAAAGGGGAVLALQDSGNLVAVELEVAVGPHLHGGGLAGGRYGFDAVAVVEGQQRHTGSPAQQGLAAGEVGIDTFCLQLTNAAAGAGFVAVGHHIAGGAGARNVSVAGNGQVRHSGLVLRHSGSLLGRQHQVSRAGAAEVGFIIGQAEALFGGDGAEPGPEDDIGMGLEGALEQLAGAAAFAFVAAVDIGAAQLDMA